MVGCWWCSLPSSLEARKWHLKTAATTSATAPMARGMYRAYMQKRQTATHKSAPFWCKHSHVTTVKRCANTYHFIWNSSVDRWPALSHSGSEWAAVWTGCTLESQVAPVASFQLQTAPPEQHAMHTLYTHVIHDLKIPQALKPILKQFRTQLLDHVFSLYLKKHSCPKRWGTSKGMEMALECVWPLLDVLRPFSTHLHQSSHF